MRKIILVAALVLVSASAQAAGPRSLSLAAANEHASVPQITTATATTQVSEAAPVTEVPKYLDRPPAVSTAAPVAPTTTTSAPATTATPAAKTMAKADKPKHKRYWTEGRIIGELHRHGIYW
ncbi:hypothetical protein IVB18_00370 [Bradyrhizobium sp. 186]|uniref:hypothetical protein n=1 Tax=Bradyrhizobium sp. 186 TaxID=2782654 RepID=UPI002000B5FE|nr:hypothetical protein [Bradyrhizobium sp. 186]UPK35876.1 hypothetical protein IVB18_00370 [Bradyrhizobium sp. 186]